MKSSHSLVFLPWLACLCVILSPSLVLGCISRAHAVPASGNADPEGQARRRPDSLHAHQQEWPGTCAKAKENPALARQSPIALSDANFGTGKAAGLKLGKGPLLADLVDTGHTFQLRFTSTTSDLEFEGRRYALKQMHFHKPAEHIINGRQLDMEMHIVYAREDASSDGKNSDERKIFVVGFPIERGSLNSELQNSWQHLPPVREGYGEDMNALVDWKIFSRHDEIDVRKLHAGETVLRKAVAIDFNRLLPSQVPFYVYEGSLTTPGCDETVTFAVATTPLQMSDAQMEHFEGYYEGNNRDPQPVGDVTARRFRKALIITATGL